MMEALEAMTYAQEDWCEQGWCFRLYLTSPTSEAAIDALEVLTLMKYLITSRVVSTIDPAEVTRQGFVIGSALADGCVRIQICWWTLGGELHREAILWGPSTRCWEQLPPWEIGNTNEIIVITREAADFFQSLRK
ncbi:hypothetical protein HGO34_12210 [Agrobacterium vitis]|uniref:Uncharacterized protein n=1 Tax=Agrobacterium vitis TaxID=373 RepID=A0AAE4WDB6_AGRVI|nr:hypothetical protein [Agrobacterium vitis]MCF1498351.1 hypothetical protein [Allorhizobium sp. Av2]MCM2440478.1 hypothetical protein [Agrobacterium vitis]MUZ58274.1 hypothetical protein [Agrobacterium vitis]MVA66236.1 hypothetical protein [Agrobacterium vitis]MVA87154.1 hypothetical protein [Agrobacterium vitis]